MKYALYKGEERVSEPLSRRDFVEAQMKILHWEAFRRGEKLTGYSIREVDDD